MVRVLRWPLAVAGLCVLTAMASPGWAQTATERARISLQNADGSFSISGDLVGFEDGHYLIDVQNIGVLRIDSRAVECTGDGCPVLSPEFGISANPLVARTLLPALLRGYAASIEATYSEEAGDGADVRIIRLTDSEGTVRAAVTLAASDSATAFGALAQENADIAVTDHRMDDADAAALTATGLTDLRETEHELVLGADATVILTHPSNTIRNLSELEIARIYAGEIGNWAELGGPDLPITANALGAGSARRDRFAAAVLQPSGLAERDGIFEWAFEAEMIAAVAGDPGAIGYAGRSTALGRPVTMMPLRETCGLVSKPSAFAIKTGGYRFANPLYAYKRPGRIHPEAEALLDWALGEDAQPWIRDSGFIDRGLERMWLEDMGTTLIHTAAVEPDFNGGQYARMMQDLRFADRVSISFRFLEGSTTLDIESIRNLEVLADRIASGAFEGQDILLVGLTDSFGDRVRNTQLAARRSEVVRENLLASLDPEVAERVTLVPLSYGELLPMACNTDESGRERNRRVEVWLRRPGQ